MLSLQSTHPYDAYKANAATGAFIIIDRLSNNTVGADDPRARRPPRRGDHGARNRGGRLKQKASRITQPSAKSDWAKKAQTVLLSPDRLAQGNHRIRARKQLFEMGPLGHGALRSRHAPGTCRGPGLYGG